MSFSEAHRRLHPNRASAVTYDTDLNIGSLYVGAAGNVELILAGDTVARVFKGCPAGLILPFQIKQVVSTNTTVAAADLVGLG